MKNLFEDVKIAGESLPARSPLSIALSMVSEVGELAEEVSIAEGMSYKRPGSDGEFGEAIDILITVLDYIQTVRPGVTEEEIQTYAAKKIDKWVTKTLEAAAKKNK